MQKEIDRLSRKLGRTSQELDQTNKQLVTSRDEYTGMQEELDRVKEELGSTQVQLTKERSMLGAQEQDKLIEGERAQRFELLDELREVNKENASLRKQLANSGVASVANVANVTDPGANYRPRGIGPKKQLTGTDPSAFTPWKWAVNDKFCVDSVIFPTEEDKISYAFHQLDQPIFQQLDAWIGPNSKSLTMDGFYKQIEHCMGIHMLTERAKEKLHTVTIKSNETVDEYYQQIFKLWEQAKTPERKRVKRFEITLKPSILHALIGQKHTKIMDVLDAAREIEHKKSQISSKFFRDSAKPFQKASGSSGRTWGKNSSLLQASGSSSTVANSVATTATSSSSGAPKGSGKPVNTSTSANPNSKFIPTSTKPAGWVGTWYNPEAYPQKLQDSERTTLLQQGRCWGCKGSKHRGSNECCLLTGRRAGLSMTTARAVEEVSDFEAEKA